MDHQKKFGPVEGQSIILGHIVKVHENIEKWLLFLFYMPTYADFQIQIFAKKGNQLY